MQAIFTFSGAVRQLFRGWLWAALLVLGGLLLAGPARAQRISAGLAHKLSIHPDGTLWAWGRNDQGQLGVLSASRFVAAPVQVGTATTWRSVAAGTACSLAIRQDGTLWAWGYNGSGQLGDGTTTDHTLPTQVGTAANWLTVSAGTSVVVAVRTDGTLWAWGSNGSGQLGIGSGQSGTQPTPVQVGTATNWLTVSVGDTHVVALRTDGTLWAWGYNTRGQLGLNLGFGVFRYVPTQVGTATTWRSLSAGTAHTLAVRQDGSLWVWGSNEGGQLGIGVDDVNSSVGEPTQVGTATTWVSVAGGYLHSLAVRQNGTLWGWGNNRYGAVGVPDLGRQVSPVQVGTATTWRSVAAGTAHSLALQQDDSAWSWGHNTYGELGTGEGLQQVPGSAAPPAGYQQASAGSDFGLAVRPDGTLWAWGSNDSGKLGLGATSGLDQVTPAQVGTAATWRSASAGYLHALAVRTDGTLWAWGTGSSGVLGLGTTTNRPAPVQVGTASTWSSVSAGTRTSAAIRTDGTLWSWGANTAGGLGQGVSSTTATQTTPAQVGTATTWRSVSVGDSHTLAVRADGTLWAWGDNRQGELGDGTTTDRNAPVQVGTATTWLSVSAGYLHSLAVRQDGSLWAWGWNALGQLGDGSFNGRTEPAQVSPGTTWLSASAGQTHSLAVRADGTLWAWGTGRESQLGLGPLVTRTLPGQVGTDLWRSASAGTTFSLALKPDNSRWTWGFNDHGQLGYGSPINPLPVYIANGGTTLATANPAATAAWTLAPNPTRDYVQVLGLPAGPVAVRLYDATGRLVREAGTATVPAAGLAPGLYLLRATVAEATRTLRLAIE